MASKSIIAYFNEIPDPRRGAGQRHEQTLVLILMLMSIMSGYIGYRAIGDFIKRNKEALLKDLQPKKSRLPSFDTVRRVIQGIDFSMISKQFQQWALQHVSICEEDWISIDGKAIRGTVENAGTPHLQFVSLVSVYCSKQKLLIGNQQIIGKKDTEITVVQQLLKALKLEGVTFTLDALHCQKKQPPLLLKAAMTT
jgi:DDE_Tnp_1-associated